MFKVFRAVLPPGAPATTRPLVHEQPDENSDFKLANFGYFIVILEEDDQTDEFVKADVRQIWAAEPFTGWIKKEFVGDDPISLNDLYAEQNGFAEDFFVRSCVRMQLRTSSGGDAAGHTVSAEFLVAVAMLMSKLDTFETRLDGTDAIGPYQLTGAEWAGFLADNPDIGLTPADRISHYQQIPCAAYLLQKHANALRDKVLAVTPDDKDYMPSFMDVFLAWLTSADAADAINTAHAGDNKNQPVRPLIEANVDDFDLAAKKCGLLIDVTNAGLSVDAFVEKIANELNQKLKMAFNKMKEHAKEYLVRPTGKAPWMDAVQTEFDTWNVTPPFDELSDQGKALTLKYFQAIYSTWTQTPTPAWCGAFAAFCVKDGGLGDTIPHVAEGARNWRNWGNISIPTTADSYPVGAVVMTSKSSTNRQIGHVTFYKGHLDGKKKIECIGGNQGPDGRVTLGTFDVSRVVAVRWHGAVSEVNEDAAMVVAMTLYGEARNQDAAGQQAVASVILNRVAKQKAFYGLNAKDVCLKPWQFSCWNKNDPNRAILTNPANHTTDTFLQCLDIAQSALAGTLDDNSGGATHYYANYIPKPSWLINNPNGPQQTAQHGVHLFYKNVDD